jgi:hypothetical protein
VREQETILDRMLIKPAVADELATGQLVALRLEGPPIVTHLVAAYRTRPTISPVIREFIDVIRRGLPNRDRDVVGTPTRRPVAAKTLARSTPRRRRRRG